MFTLAIAWLECSKQLNTRLSGKCWQNARITADIHYTVGLLSCQLQNAQCCALKKPISLSKVTGHRCCCCCRQWLHGCLSRRHNKSRCDCCNCQPTSDSFRGVHHCIVATNGPSEVMTAEQTQTQHLVERRFHTTADYSNLVLTPGE